jgi:hypothetical protein
MTLSIHCPSCGKQVSIPEEAKGKKVSCAFCKHVFVAAVTDELAGDIGDQSTSELPLGHEAESNLMDRFLAFIEDCLKRMIVGIPRFLVSSISNVVRFIVRSASLAIRLSRIAFYLAVLTTIVLGPALVAWIDVLWSPSWRLAPFPWQVMEWIRQYEYLLRVGSAVWLALAFCGALWGLVRVRKERKRRRAIS